MRKFDSLWSKLRNKEYREEFVAAQVKRGIPFQISAMLKARDMSQDDLAREAGLTQGVISRAADMSYGNLTVNTIIRIAAGFDVAFVGAFVPFDELGSWFINLSEETVGNVPTFAEQDANFPQRSQQMNNDKSVPAVSETTPAIRECGDPPVATCSEHPDSFNSDCICCAQARNAMRQLTERLARAEGRDA